MSYRVASILVTILFFTTSEVNACSIALLPKKVIEITKMKGVSNPDLKYLEAIGWLYYEGEKDLTIYSSKKNIVATFKRGILCTYTKGASVCEQKTGMYFDLSSDNPNFASKKTFNLLLQVENAEPIKYQFKRVLVKYKEKYDGQRFLRSIQGCPDDE